MTSRTYRCGSSVFVLSSKTTIEPSSEIAFLTFAPSVPSTGLAAVPFEKANEGEMAFALLEEVAGAAIRPREHGSVEDRMEWSRLGVPATKSDVTAVGNRPIFRL